MKHTAFAAALGGTLLVGACVSMSALETVSTRTLRPGATLVPQRSFYKFADMWSQAWWEFREKLREGKIALRAAHPMLVKDLTAPRYTITNKVITVESSEDIRERINRSPDVGVSVVLACFDFPKRERQSSRAQGPFVSQRVTHGHPGR